MALSLKVPALGESISEATLGAWKRAEGDYVEADEPLVEVESEKATLEVGAPGAGVLKKILRKAGDTVAVGEVIAEIDQIAKPQTAKAPPAKAGNGHPPAEAVAAAAAPAASNDGGVLRAPPSARRLLTETGLPASEVTGTGRGGRISKQDVVRALQERTDKPETRAPAPPPEPRPSPSSSSEGARERIVPMSPLRKTVARRLVEAQHTAAILTTFNEVDMTNVMSLRERFQERFQKQYNVKLGFMSFFVKAAIDALKAFPAVNAEIRGTDIIYKDHYDIGVAVGGGKGLVVPVVPDADRLSFAELEKTIGDLAARARDNKLTMKELEGGTFTISNGGVYGSMLSTPILNPPQ
ncbi:MAG TPA: dihydrolipoyllysine-residue succinyltransferase, partial [Polyangia bacterium]|nr:dihydrolipoyllysine-residue succinyltransferase [Polyangia bacterium]